MLEKKTCLYVEKKLDKLGDAEKIMKGEGDKKLYHTVIIEFLLKKYSK